MIRFLATVAERDYDMTTKVYSKNIPWNVVRTVSEPLKIERFGRFKNKNVSNQTWKAWQTWFATVRFAFNKFFNLLQARSTSRTGLRINYIAWTHLLKKWKRK